MEIIVDAETKQNPRRRLGDPRILYIINAGARCSAPCRSIRLCLNSSRPRLARCAPFPEVSRSPAKPLAVQRPDRVRTPAFQPIRGPWRKRRNRLVAARVAVVNISRLRAEICRRPTVSRWRQLMRQQDPQMCCPALPILDCRKGLRCFSRSQEAPQGLNGKRLG
jgi:hypothetical protein